MEPENDELETELEQPTETGDGDAGANTSGHSEGADGSDATGDASASAGKESDGPKSLAEALSQGIDAVANKGKKPTEASDKNEDGTEKTAEQKEAEKQKAVDGKQPDADGKDKDAKSKVDYVNDPIDARLAPRTQERIRSLASEVKELREIAGNNGTITDAIMKTGASPEEFGAMVGYLDAVHSEDPKKLEAAYNLLQSELQGLALKMGKAIPEVDWLSGHKDLIDAVRSGATTRDLAVEIAMRRAETKRNQDIAAAKATKTQKTQQSTEQAAADQKQATKDLDALGDELAAADPNYGAKYAILVPKLKAAFATIPPSQWKGKFLEEYAKLQVKPKAVAQTTDLPGQVRGTPPVNKPKGQPLRPSTPSGSATKAPSSALDALSSAIDGMRG